MCYIRLLRTGNSPFLCPSPPECVWEEKEKIVKKEAETETESSAYYTSVASLTKNKGSLSRLGLYDCSNRGRLCIHPSYI